MASTYSLHIELPPELYSRLQQAARQTQQPIESVLVESLALLYDAPSGSQEARLAVLEGYSDAQLWAVVYQRLTAPENTRLHDLLAANRDGTLASGEESELDGLVKKVEEQMVVRSKALALLQQRGYDVRTYFEKGQ